MPEMIILAGSRTAVPDGLLAAHIRHARSGSRLLIVDEGGLTASHADQERDLLIDPARGNWDIASDCRNESECLCVAKALTGEGSLLFGQLAATALAGLLLDVVEEPRTDLGQLSARVRAMPPGAIELPTGLSDPGDRLVLTVRAVLRTAAGSFPPRDRSMPPTSFRRWYDNPAGRVLYLRAPPGDAGAVAVGRAILAIASRSTANPADHALVAFGHGCAPGDELAA